MTGLSHFTCAHDCQAMRLLYCCLQTHMCQTSCQHAVSCQLMMGPVRPAWPPASAATRPPRPLQMLTSCSSTMSSQGALLLKVPLLKSPVSQQQQQQQNQSQQLAQPCRQVRQHTLQSHAAPAWRRARGAATAQQGSSPGLLAPTGALWCRSWGPCWPGGQGSSLQQLAERQQVQPLSRLNPATLAVSSSSSSWVCLC
jgi:hypothetical protein